MCRQVNQLWNARMHPEKEVERVQTEQLEKKEYVRDKAGAFVDLTNGKSKALGTVKVPGSGTGAGGGGVKQNHKGARGGGKPRQRPAPNPALAATNAIAGLSRHPDRTCQWFELQLFTCTFLLPRAPRRVDGCLWRCCLLCCGNCLIATQSSTLIG